MADGQAPAVPVPLARTFQNPVLDADFPDPAVILAPDGFYYAYATQTLRDEHWVNIQVARSADLVHWHFLGDAMPEKPAWAANTQDFWAPYVFQDGDRFLMYYSATPDVCDVPERGHCLAIATSSSPAGPFTDIGMNCAYRSWSCGITARRSSKANRRPPSRTR